MTSPEANLQASTILCMVCRIISMLKLLFFHMDTYPDIQAGVLPTRVIHRSRLLNAYMLEGKADAHMTRVTTVEKNSACIILRSSLRTTRVHVQKHMQHSIYPTVTLTCHPSYILIDLFLRGLLFSNGCIYL